MLLKDECCIAVVSAKIQSISWTAYYLCYDVVPLKTTHSSGIAGSSTCSGEVLDVMLGSWVRVRVRVFPLVQFVKYSACLIRTSVKGNTHV